jgi:hypothetical protein
LSFGGNLQQFVILPNRTRNTSAVADVVQVKDDDRQDLQPVIALLEM